MTSSDAERPLLPPVRRSDVARVAGVSTAVVSYVVNGGPKRVAPETEAKVREAVARLGYRPNASARALRKGTIDVLGLIVSDSHNPFFTELASAVERAAAPSGYALMTANSAGSATAQSRLLEDMLYRQVGGVIASTVGYGIPDAYLHMPKPVVWIDAAHPVPGYNTVGSDFRAGGELAVRHLVEEHGHRSVALLTGDLLAANPREEGWRAALRAAGLLDGPIERCAWTRESAYAAGARLLELAEPPTAVLACSDLLAVGLLRAAHERGLSLPRDLAVVSFDGTKESEFSWPPLTTVRQDVDRIAREAVALVLNPPREARHYQIGVQLLVRSSCGCPV